MIIGQLLGYTVSRKLVVCGRLRRVIGEITYNGDDFSGNPFVKYGHPSVKVTLVSMATLSRVGVDDRVVSLGWFEGLPDDPDKRADEVFRLLGVLK